MKPNILFIMCDQLRRDYLGCYGHPTIRTPNIDGLAEDGVRFDNAFCQAALCGPSRASFYTGRYMSSHGSMANDDPLKLGELTIGDYLEALGYRTALAGKTHTNYNRVELSRRGVDDDASRLARLACGGFEPWEVHEGLYPDPILPADLGYNGYLSGHGYGGSNPWQYHANSSAGTDGRVLDGWLLRNNGLPARVEAAHSESAFITDRALAFIDDAGNDPWCLHLSYIKPHWPLVAPAPYHELYDRDDLIPVVRSSAETDAAHPVYHAFTQLEYSVNYSRDEVRDLVAPIYMGLISEVDDHLGRLFDHLRAKDLWDNTLIVFTSDHGDYLGDHWLGEKDLLHDCSSAIPLIVRDPLAPSSWRGRAEDALVEAIDVVPTFVEAAGGMPCRERLEGSTLMPYLRGSDGRDDGSEVFRSRDFVVSELDYSDRGARKILGVPPYRCRAWMLRSTTWKYIYYEGFRPQLFDLGEDPDELHDLGGHSNQHDRMREFESLLFAWLRQRKTRTEMPFDSLEGMGPELDEQFGIIIGRW